jgi:hypothetical protein
MAWAVETRAEWIVAERESGVHGGAGKGRVRHREEAVFEPGITEVADGKRGRERRDQDKVGRREVGRKAVLEPQTGVSLVRRPGGEGASEKDIQGRRSNVPTSGANK